MELKLERQTRIMYVRFFLMVKNLCYNVLYTLKFLLLVLFIVGNVHADYQIQYPHGSQNVSSLKPRRSLEAMTF